MAIQKHGEELHALDEQREALIAAHQAKLGGLQSKCNTVEAELQEHIRRHPGGAAPQTDTPPTQQQILEMAQSEVTHLGQQLQEDPRL